MPIPAVLGHKSAEIHAAGLHMSLITNRVVCSDNGERLDQLYGTTTCGRSPSLMFLCLPVDDVEAHVEIASWDWKREKGPCSARSRAVLFNRIFDQAVVFPLSIAAYVCCRICAKLLGAVLEMHAAGLHMSLVASRVVCSDNGEMVDQL
jgi:hypothetical protein